MTNGERRRIGVLLVRNSGSHCMCAISANDHTSEQSVQGFVRRLRDTPCSGVKLLGFVDVDKGEITNAEGTEDLGLAESVLAR
ncbi:MAG: hypothetical protein FJZ04_03495, partial [Candidatus Moranbacteria bacterium]|nr:hypothetical protein [Candidatus Moranbacteria bacterium]